MRLIPTSLLTILVLAAFGSDAHAMGCRYEPAQVIAMCPALKQYTVEDEKRLAAEMVAMRATNPSSVALRVITDAFALRQPCRALGKTK